MRVWITRDGGKNHAIAIWNGSKPIAKSDGLFYPNYDDGKSRMVDIMDVWPQSEFKTFFGFTPRKGSCKRYNLTLEEIK